MMINKKTEILDSNEGGLLRAKELLLSEEIIAFPTETVYGLGASLFLPKAIEKIYQAKGRPMDNPLIVHALDLEEIKRLAIEIPDEFFLLANQFMPGPLTVVLKRHPKVTEMISCGLPSIAIRMPSYPIARELIRLAGPLAAPSANLSGKPSSTTAQHVLDDFNGKIAAVIDGGAATLGIESTVISLLDSKYPVLLRPGEITKEQIEAVLGRTVRVGSKKSKDAAVSPGMKYRHYAPLAQVKLFTDLKRMNAYLDKNGNGKRLFLGSKPYPELDFQLISNKNLYSLLRLADAKGYEEIIVYCDEAIQRNEALMNRLLHAAE